MLVNNGEGEEDAKLLLERKPDIVVKSISYRYDNDKEAGLVTIVQNDNGTKTTILTTINLQRLMEDEEEEARKLEEQKKQEEYEQQMEASMSAEDFKVWKMLQQSAQAGADAQI